MKPLLIVSVFIILLSACKKDDELTLDLIPGEYKGSLNYIGLLSDGTWGGTNQGISVSDTFKTTIRKNGSDYVLSFDKDLPNKLPDISLQLLSRFGSEAVAIKTLDGQEYFSMVIPDYYQNEPNNYFSISKFPKVVNCNLYLESLDKTHFLWLVLYRTY